MKKLLAGALALAPAIAFVPVTSASASADSVCAPITVDGQPVCQDLTPLQQALAQASALVASVIGNPETASHCVLGTMSPSTDEVTVDVVFGDQFGYERCYGNEITVKPSIAVPSQTQHVHVPQVCVTTTDTCVGPLDRDLEVPSDLSASLSVCVTPVTIYNDGFGWRRAYTGPSTCVPSPSP